LFGDYVSGRVFRLNRTSTTGTNQWTRSDFITGLGSSSAVHLEFGPGATGTGAALYYTNYQGGGQIRRVTYASTGTPPSAALTANPTQGAAPLTVNFDASASTGTGPLSYSWNFGNGQTASGNATRSFTYTSPGVFTATVTVTNSVGASTAQRVIQVGTPPTVTLTQPGPGATFTVGAQIGLQGSATSSLGQSLPGSALSWEVRLHHIDEVNPTNRHFHPFFTRNGQATASFTAPAPEDLRAARFSYLEVRLTATDALGLSTTITREVRPQLVTLGFATQPGGLLVNASDTVMTVPVNNASVYSWPGWVITATVPAQIVNGQRLVFDRWSDGNRSNPRAFTTGATAITYTVQLAAPAYTVFLPRIGR
jgi:PKD repeat protein